MSQATGETREGRAGEFTIGSADIDVAALGVTLTGTGGVIVGFRVLSGSGVLAYQGRKPVTQQLGNGVALQPGDDIEPWWGVVITKINGTGNATPSAALTLRAVWA